MSRSLIVQFFWVAFGVLVASTVIGLVTLWPADRTSEKPLGLKRSARSGEEGGAVIEPGRAIERLAVDVSNPQLAQPLRELRMELELARRGAVQPVRSRFELLGRDGDL